MLDEGSAGGSRGSVHCRALSTAWLVGLGLACGDPGGKAPTAEAPVLPSAPQWLQDFADGLSAANRGQAASIAVRLADGTRWEVAAGRRGGPGSAPALPRDLVQIGSSSKMFTAATILRLQEAGQLNIEDPVTLHLDAGLLEGLTVDPIDDVRLWMLLNHTSGMSDYLNFGEDAATLRYYAGRPDSFTPTDLLDLTRELGLPPAPSTPGGVTQYSNTGYILLGMVIEAVTGLSYEDVVRRELLEPLGLEHTAFLTTGGSSPRQGFAAGEPVTFQGTLGWSAGGVVAEPLDVAEFVFQLLDGGVYASPEILELQRAGHLSRRQGVLPYGLGLEMFPPALGLLVGHAGQTFGFQNLPYQAAETGAVVVVNVNDSSAVGIVSEEEPEADLLSLELAIHQRIAEGSAQTNGSSVAGF